MATYHLSAKVGQKGKGCAHSDYIERAGKNAKHQDLEHAENGNLPAWANGKSSTFWKAADEHERENGSVYRELEIALPRELTPAQRLELVREFISQEIGDKHAYSFAIHCPKAALDPAKGEQPHAHIMYSERLRDGIERPKEQYFKRYNSKNPERGGHKKAIPKDMLEKKQQLRDQRERWAELQNRHLSRHGHQSRVDHRTLEAQGIQRDPEKHLPHLGVAAIAIARKREQPSTRIRMFDTRYKSLRAEHEKRLDSSPKPTEKQPEPQAKPSQGQPTDSELLRALQARYAIVREHNSIKAANSRELAAIQKNEASIRSERRRLEQEHAELGSRPLLFGKADWDAKKKAMDDRYLVTFNQLQPVKERIKELTEGLKPENLMEAAIHRVRSLGFTEAEIKLARHKDHMANAEKIRERQERAVIEAKRAPKTQEKPLGAIKTTETGKSTPEMKKTLTERLQASMGAFVQWIKDKGGIHKEITPNGTHTGKIEQVDDLHAVQHLGRGTYTIHKLDQLDEVPKLNNMATIKYREGRGLVEQKAPDRGMGMSR